MDDSGQRENGRHKDHYKSVHALWMMPQHQMKDNHTMKLMALVAERDNAIPECNLVLAEKKAALAERDMAILQRDGAIAERNTVIMERDNALAALEYARSSAITGNGGCSAQRGAKHFNHQRQQHQQQHQLHPPLQLSYTTFNNNAREMHVNDAYQISAVSDSGVKGRRARRSRKDSKTLASNPGKKATRSLRKGKQINGGEDLNRQVTVAKSLDEWNKQVIGSKYFEWKGQDLGLNRVPFDDIMIPPPGCSCTGKFQQCYKWGNGGWQSACCTTTLSSILCRLCRTNGMQGLLGGR